MIPFMSPELVASAVEMMCYFCTVVGVTLAFWLAPRG
jgi:hypothetical protein